MTQLLQPGNVPAWDGTDAANTIADTFAFETWPELWPKLQYAFADTAERDAELAALGPSDRVMCYTDADQTMWRWSGSAWVRLTATSAAKMGKRAHWGSANITTDASGFATVTHGAGFSPQIVLCNLGRTTGSLYDVTRVSDGNSTTFKVRVIDPATGTVIGAVSGIPIAFFCGE